MKCRKVILALLGVALAASCSTTRNIPEGEYRLAKNRIKVDGKKVSSSELSSYVIQKANTSILGYSPGLAVYNWADTSDTWLNNLFRKIGSAPVIFDSTRVAATEENIANHLEYIGWYRSTVTSEVEYKGKRAYVTYHVHPGTRYKIGSIRYELPQSKEFADDFAADLRRTGIKVGQYLSESALEEETERSAKNFRDRGYYGFNKSFYYFEADTLKGDGFADLMMAIRDYPRGGNPDQAEPHRKYRVGDVRLSYPAEVPIRTSILENLNILRPGMPYSERIVNAAYNRLSNLSVFNGVNITMTPVSEDVVDCNIALQNGSVQGFKANLEASVNSTGLFGISPQWTYYHKNLFHGGELFNLALQGNFQFKPNESVRSTEFSVSSSLRFPKFIGLPNRYFRGPNLPHTDLNLAFSYQDRPEYKRTMISTSFGYTGSLGRNFFYQFYPIQGNVVRLFSIDESFFEKLVTDVFMLNAYSDHFDLGVGGMLYYTTDASAIPKHSYRYARLNFDVSGNVLSLFNSAMPTNAYGARTIWETPYSQYVRGELHLGDTFRFGGADNQALALHFVIGAGHAYGNSMTIPFEKQFYCGGANSMRGWQARSLGPGSMEPLTEYFVIPSQTGEFKMEANVEYRFPLFWKLEGAAFVDAGNIWDLTLTEFMKAAAFSFDSIAADWGLGLRVNLDFILVRIDWGAKVYEPYRPVDERLIGPADWLKRGNFALHFGVGYPF